MRRETTKHKYDIDYILQCIKEEMLKYEELSKDTAWQQSILTGNMDAQIQCNNWGRWGKPEECNDGWIFYDMLNEDYELLNHIIETVENQYPSPFVIEAKIGFYKLITISAQYDFFSDY